MERTFRKQRLTMNQILYAKDFFRTHPNFDDRPLTRINDVIEEMLKEDNPDTVHLTLFHVRAYIDYVLNNYSKEPKPSDETDLQRKIREEYCRIPQPENPEFCIRAEDKQ
jgi:hypothetical protein